MISDEARRAAAQSRTAQGLPATVQDARALTQIAEIMRPIIVAAQQAPKSKRRRRRRD